MYTLLVACLFVLIGVQNSIANQPIHLKSGIVTAPSGMFYEGTKKFGDLLEQKSNGRIKTELLHSGALGGERELIESLSMGSIDYAYTAAAPISGFAKEFNLLELPYLSDSAKAIEEKIDGPLGKKLFEILDKMGILGLGYFDAGYRNLQTKKPVRSIQDIKGMKIRVMESPVFLDLFKAFGALPLPMPYSEIYTALQQGVIDGIELPSDPFYSSKFYEVTKNFTTTQHSFTINPFMMSKKTFMKLPPDLQKIVIECGREATIFQRSLREKRDHELEEKIKNQGVTIQKVDLTPFMKIGQPIREKYLKNYSQDIVKYIQ